MSDTTNMSPAPIGSGSKANSSSFLADSLERFRTWRTQTIAGPRFRTFAQRFALTRPVANGHANALYQLTAGFVYTQVLKTCVELDIFEQLKNGPASLGALALDCDVPREQLEKLLLAAQGIDLLRKRRDGNWALADTGAVVATNPGIQALARHNGDVYDDIADLTGLLRDPGRQTKTAQFWSYVQAAGGPQSVDHQKAQTYSDLMSVTQDLVVENTLNAYDFSKHETLLDVGGGSGAFISAVANRHQELNVQLIDLPPVAAQARAKLESASFANRLIVHGGSFFDATIPNRADCYTLVRVLYDHPDDAVIKILKNIRASMSADDTLLIAEPMAGAKPGEKLAAAYFHIYLLAMRSGQCRDSKDHFALLRKAGFTRMKTLRTNLPVASGLICAQV